MKTEKELQELSVNISKAISAYRKAVAENLKESGKEHKVIGNFDEDEGLYLTLHDDDSVDTILVDKVRWNNELNCVEYHSAEWNFNVTNTWTPIHWLNEEIEYIYDAIEW